MFIYIGMYILILLNMVLFFFLKNRKLEKLLFILFIVILSVLAGTRLNVGVDYISYINIFENVNSNLEIRGVEKLFLFIVYTLKNNYYLKNESIFLVFSIINFFLLYRFVIRNLNSNLFISLFIWYTFYFLRLDMGQFRFELAILICLNLIFYFEKASYIKFLLGVLFSFFIHKTSIIYFSVLLVKSKILKKKNIFFIIIFSFFIGKIIISSNVLVLVGNLVNSLKLKSMVYGKSVYEVGFSFYQLYIILIFIFLSFYKTKNFRINLYKNIYNLGVCFYFLFINLAIFSDRMSLIFIIIQIVLYPLVINDMRKRNNKIIILLFIIVISSYVFFNSLLNSIETHIPYNSWLF